MPDQSLQTAYESLIDTLEKNYLGLTPAIDVTGKELGAELKLGDAVLRKYEDPDSQLLICHAEYPSGSIWWHQAGDNTSDVLCMYGADPAQAAEFDRLKVFELDPLDVVYIFRLNEPAHWLYITFGLCDLYGTEGDTDGDSGFGIELTMRLAISEDDSTPPRWPSIILRDLARHLFESKETLRYGEFVDFGGPIFPKTPTQIEGLAIGFDPTLEPLETSSGYVDIFNLTGLTRDEIELSRQMNTSLPLGTAFAKVYGQNEIALFDHQRNSLLIEHPEAVASAILLHADVWAAKNRFKNIEPMLVGSLDLMRAEGGPVFGNALQHLYEAAKANGEVDDALAYAMELVSLLEENDQDDLVADTLEEMGNLCLLNEKDEMGNDFLERATNIRKALGQQPE